MEPIPGLIMVHRHQNEWLIGEIDWIHVSCSQEAHTVRVQSEKSKEYTVPIWDNIFVDFGSIKKKRTIIIDVIMKTVIWEPGWGGDHCFLPRAVFWRVIGLI